MTENKNSEFARILFEQRIRYFVSYLYRYNIYLLSCPTVFDKLCVLIQQGILPADSKLTNLIFQTIVSSDDITFNYSNFDLSCREEEFIYGLESIRSIFSKFKDIKNDELETDLMFKSNDLIWGNVSFDSIYNFSKNFEFADSERIKRDVDTINAEDSPFSSKHYKFSNNVDLNLLDGSNKFLTNFPGSLKKYKLSTSSCAYYKLANLYFYGYKNKIKKNLKEAYEYYKRAAETGSFLGAFCCGTFYENGIFVEKDLNKAFEYYKSCTLLPGASLKIGLRYLKDESTKEEGIQYLQRAASSGNCKAIVELGKLFKRKTFISSSASNFLFLNSALMGSSEAKYNLAQLWLDGIFVSSIPFDLKKILEEAAAEGNIQAFVEYTERYIDGSDRIRYFKDAAKLGNSEAIFQLGLEYLNGSNVEQSYKNAAVLFSKGTRLQHAKSAFHLAKLYENGQGVELSREKARILYSISSKLGNLDAKFSLLGMIIEDCGEEFMKGLEEFTKKIDEILK